jgi:hypothetical protein
VNEEKLPLVRSCGELNAAEDLEEIHLSGNVECREIATYSSVLRNFSCSAFITFPVH